MNLKSIFNLIISIVTGLLLVRLVMLLMAADPASPFVRLVLALTAPLVSPLAWLDANQPTFGVRFERGTLFLVCLLMMVGTILNLYLQRKQRHE